MATAASSLHAATGNERFNNEAANWDNNPFVHEASKQAWKAILAKFPALKDAPGQNGLDVLELGCGTGLLSSIIAPYAKRVVAVDAAPGMIEVLKNKLQKPGAPQNIYPLAVLLEDADDKRLPPADESDPNGPRLRFDLIISHLVLHHIPDLGKVLTTMKDCLKHSAWVALTDYEDAGPDSKSFHARSRMEGVARHGIHLETMEVLMNEVGFVNVNVERAWSMDKNVEKVDGEFGEAGRASRAGQGQVRSFPFLLCMGEKKYCP
ncbi:S-adenosyl-L-methionine-dependent methyltransferase [Exophiala viscosa]|uniref:S-adenosyl-L-methionine-dependent methyltransferase n=1 Tax=Exophiala viscosa TaxID=2486360 RepID=UPI0021944627|nr:S-adenosyl-L-methionine-dependent methyltransferase [Exophiala viscosa]